MFGADLRRYPHPGPLRLGRKTAVKNFAGATPSHSTTNGTISLAAKNSCCNSPPTTIHTNMHWQAIGVERRMIEQ